MTANPQILPGYRVGAIGRIVELHARFYAQHAGSGRFFEAKVARELAEFTSRLGVGRSELWLVVGDGRILGSVAIDGEDLGGHVAHLRWFILDEQVRGAGFGRRLLSAALAFADGQGFVETQLWTFSGLNAAQSLYEASGFTVIEERSGAQWGEEVVERRYVRPRP